MIRGQRKEKYRKHQASVTLEKKEGGRDGRERGAEEKIVERGNAEGESSALRKSTIRERRHTGREALQASPVAGRIVAGKLRVGKKFRRVSRGRGKGGNKGGRKQADNKASPRSRRFEKRVA